MTHPHDPDDRDDAAAAVVAFALQGKTKALELMRPEDFRDPRLAEVVRSVFTLIERGTPVDLITVADELESRRRLTAVGGRAALHELSIGDVFGDPLWWATIARKRARMRELRDVCTRLSALLAYDLRETLDGEGDDPVAPDYPDQVIARTRAELEAIAPELLADVEGSLLTARQLLDQVDRADEWIVPGLIARGDRHYVTGFEGLAKSTLLRQVAACTAAGLNPFTGDRVADGHRVAIVDVENTPRQIKRGLLMLRPRIDRRLAARGWLDRIAIESQLAGINLLAARDVRQLRRFLDRARPDLLIIGPVYKLMRGDPNKDRDMLRVLQVLDDIRADHSLAMLVEAHSPHGAPGEVRMTRPFGSSVQLRWPEVGFGIRPDDRKEFAIERAESDARHGRVSYMELVGWRGQREHREWPAHIRFGGPDELPWVPTSTSWRPASTEYSEQPGLDLGGDQ